jgi:peptidoglycan/LPS O-acetylase OafA/YrhL
MAGTVIRNRDGRRWGQPVRWFGRHSYEIYLTHEFAVVWGVAAYVKIHRGPLWLWCAAILLISAPLGMVAAKYISEPLQRKLRRGISEIGLKPESVSRAGIAQGAGM